MLTVYISVGIVTFAGVLFRLMEEESHSGFKNLWASFVIGLFWLPILVVMVVCIIADSIYDLTHKDRII